MRLEFLRALKMCFIYPDDGSEIFLRNVADYIFYLLHVIKHRKAQSTDCINESFYWLKA
jgi:hypothetical protein